MERIEEVNNERDIPAEIQDLLEKSFRQSDLLHRFGGADYSVLPQEVINRADTAL